MKDDYEATNGDVRAALTGAFAEREIVEVAPAGPSWNDLNETVSVNFADGESVFLKIAADGDGSRVRRERAVIDYVGTHCGVRVPDIVASDASNDPPYLATAPMRERSLASQWPELRRPERTTALRQIGAALADVHSREFDRHAHIVGSDSDGLVLDAGSWTTILAERIDAMREIASSDRFERYFDEVIDAVEANRERLDLAPPTLVHGDPAMPNIFRGETTLGFVDWEIAHVGDPARELHRARDQLLESDDLEADEQFVTALYDGYRQRAGSLPTGIDDRSPIYEAVRYLGTVGFFDKVAEFSDEPTRDVATRVEAEMNERLDAVR